MTYVSALVFLFRFISLLAAMGTQIFEKDTRDVVKCWVDLGPIPVSRESRSRSEIRRKDQRLTPKPVTRTVTSFSVGCESGCAGRAVSASEALISPMV